MPNWLQGEEVIRSKQLVTSVYVILLLLLSSGCSASSNQTVGSDVTLACTLLTNPDESRVGVLMIIGAAQEDPDIVTAGRGDPFNYINSVVRDFKYPGVIDGLEATDIKNRFADALDAFAMAYLGDNKTLRLEASSNFTNVSQELRDRCTDLGFQFTEDWPNS
jgi:hypothetical protein